jgi:endoglucanase
MTRRPSALRSLRAGLLIVALSAGVPVSADTGALPGSVSAAEWQSYRSQFVRENGSVIDDANGGVSHSESAGYGMLLAFLADDSASFERIWSFTRDKLLIRDDGLAAWRWDPNTKPHVTDVNDASDGDILIAYALGLAGKGWSEARFTLAGQKLAKAIDRALVRRVGRRTILLPGVKGFTVADRPDGATVINLSYWVFEAIPMLAELSPSDDWAALRKSGIELVAAARFGPARLPSDWLALGADGSVKPAAGFEPAFGYNAIRIPLYLLRGGIEDRGLLSAFAVNWTGGKAPGVVATASGRTSATLADPGYQMLSASLACALDRTPIPEDLRQFSPTVYYPSTLHLLGLSFVAWKHPECL